jgi:histidyl-tRNA synthetase
MDLKPPRGTLDLLPPEGGRMRALYELAAKVARLYGYRYVETPAFEQTELFSRTSGETSDVVRKEMYTFEDRSGRLLTLRPEATAPIVRAFLERRHGLLTPFKAFTIGKMWRYGRPQSGRLREFRQFDIEVIGDGSPLADVEVIVVGHRFLRLAQIGEFQLQISSIGDSTCRPAYRDELLEFLRANRDRLRDEHQERFEENPLRVLDCKDERCRAVAAEAPKIVDRLCADCQRHFDEVRRELKEEGIEAVVTPTLVRGLDYYTRTTFEWVSGRLAEAQSSVGGGGRYDGLAEVLGGPPTPGVGFAIGLERVLMLLEPDEVRLNLERPDVFVVGVGEAGWAQSRDAVRALRAAGLSADAAFEARPIGTQLKMADRAEARYALIIGEKEIRARTVTLRRLSDGHQDELSLQQAVERVVADRGSP